MLSWFNQLFGEMPAPLPPRLWLHFAVTGAATAAVLMSYFWPVGPWG